MRFDGYYVLSDALGIANLHESAQQQFMRWWKTRALGQPDTADFDRVSSRRHAALALFFVGSNVYRWAVMLGIVLFVADQYWGLGLVVGLALLYSSFVAPLRKVIRPLRNPLFLYQQQGKLRLSAAVMLLLLALLLWLPVPESRVLRGVVEARHNTTLFSQSSARIVKVHASSGQWVAAGQLLIELENPELDQELRAVRAQITQARAQERKALTEASVDLGPVREKLSTLIQTQGYILQQIQSLRLRAPHDGLWHSADAIHLAGNWVARGKELGRVVDERSHIFLGVVKQEASLNWDRLKADGSQVRIEGERAMEHRVTELTVVPHSQKELPSAALTPLAGGDLAVSAQDQTGRKAVEQFFLLRAQLGPSSSQSPEAASRNGRSGWIRVHLPSRPLAERLWQWTQQFFQKRYQV
jgi:putative peptide zinc metalloprotease protein